MIITILGFLFRSHSLHKPGQHYRPRQLSLASQQTPTGEYDVTLPVDSVSDAHAVRGSIKSEYARTLCTCVVWYAQGCHLAFLNCLPAIKCFGHFEC